MVEEAKSGARHRAPGGRAARGSVPKPGRDACERARILVSPNVGEGDRNEARTALMLATRTRSKAAGLLLSGPSDKALLLVSCNDVHTVGMRHAIDVAFVDRLGRPIARSGRCAGCATPRPWPSWSVSPRAMRRGLRKATR